MTERRYGEDEVREILKRAANHAVATPASRPGAEGLALADIQSIGREVGLEPAAVAQAAAALDARPERPPRTTWGQPVEVGRIVHIPRPLSDLEWDQLVAELRSTFGARGKVTSQGTLKEWSNGNLHACMEPVEKGYRIRLGTLKGDVMAVNALGLTGLAAGVATFGSFVLSGELQAAFFVPTIFGTFGASVLLANAHRLQRWAQTRRQQMEHIANRIASIIESKPHNVEERHLTED